MGSIYVVHIEMCIKIFVSPELVVELELKRRIGRLNCGVVKLAELAGNYSKSSTASMCRLAEIRHSRTVTGLLCVGKRMFADHLRFSCYISASGGTYNFIEQFANRCWEQAQRFGPLHGRPSHLPVKAFQMLDQLR